MIKKDNRGGIVDTKKKQYRTLFLSAFYISAVTFGSGYVIVSVFKKRFVDELNWVDEAEMIDLIALAQSSPGVMAANAALLIGYKTCGAPGAFLAVLGVSLPPLFTIFMISLFYNALRDNAVVSAVLKGMQAGACAVIADVVVGMFMNVVKNKEMGLIGKMAIMLGAFAAIFVLHIHVVLIVLCAVLLGVVWHFVYQKKRGALT